MPTVQERRHRHLVGGVQYGRCAHRPARKARRASCRAGKRSGSGGSKSSRPSGAQVELGAPVAEPAGPAQGVGDRDAHVGRAQLGQHRAVAEVDQAVNDRLRVDQRPRSSAPAWPNRWCASIISSPLFIMVAQSTRDLGAHRPVRMRAPPARAWRRASRPRVQARNGPPDAVRISCSTRLGRCRPAPGRSRCARNRPAGGWRRAGAPRAMNRAPAQTRHSLLASATMAPRRTAASVGASPAAPTMPAITHSAGRAAASTTASAPAGGLDAAAGQALAQAGVTGGIADHGEPRAASASDRRQRVGPPVSGHVLRSGSVRAPRRPAPACCAQSSRWRPGS